MYAFWTAMNAPGVPPRALSGCVLSTDRLYDLRMSDAVAVLAAPRICAQEGGSNGCYTTPSPAHSPLDFETDYVPVYVCATHTREPHLVERR